MKKVMICTLILTLLAACSSNSADPVVKKKGGVPQADSSKGQLTTEQKLEDFEYMYKIIEENYPFLKVNERVNGIDWLANKAKYRMRIERTKDDRGFNRTLRTIVNELNNGHTNVITLENYAYLKKLYTITKENAIIHRPWLDVINQPTSKARYITSENSTLNSQIEQPTSLPAAATTGVVGKDVAYIKIPTLDAYRIEPDMKTIKPFLQKVRHYKTLIIDIRGNGGGDEAYWSHHLVPMLINEPISCNIYSVYRGGQNSIPFIEANLQKKFSDLIPIKKLREEKLSALPSEILTDFQRYIKIEKEISPKESIHFKGKIYLLVDQSVYSASESWAVFTEQTGWATLVGSRTGGDGIGMEPILVSMPNSGIIFRMPIGMGLKADGSIEDEVKVTPPILVTDPPQQPIAKDPAVLAVLKAEARRRQEQ